MKKPKQEKRQEENTVWTLPAGKVTAATTKLWTQLGSQGADIVARLDDDEQFRARIAKFMLQDGIESSADIKLVRVIMGEERLWGAEEWSAFYGLRFTKKQLREVAEFPWSKDVLNTPCPFYKGKSVKETHFAFLGLDVFKGKSLTILKWQELHPASGQPKFDSYAPDNWYSKKNFSNEPTCGFKWYLMPLEIVPESTYKIYAEQTAMLSADYEVPLAIEEVTKVILYYRKNGVYLNPTKYSRCQDVASVGRRVLVGGFDSRGLLVYGWSDDDRDGYIGLAASRKF